MALVVNGLKNDLFSAFQSMTDGNDTVFADKVSAAADKYAESGTITTADAGTIPAGVLTGAGTGKITCDAAICKNIVLAACTAMRSMTSGGNEYLAARLAAGIHSMVSAGQVKTTVTGTVVPPGSSPTIPMAGTAAGSMTGIPAPMQAAFSAAFTAMDSMREGGDQYMAQQMAAAVDAYLKAAAVNTRGSAALAGSAGTGKMA
jgi:hypothetical protein